MCRSGREQLCRAVNGTNYIGFVCNGGYAEYFVGKAMNAYRPARFGVGRGRGPH